MSDGSGLWLVDGPLFRDRFEAGRRLARVLPHGLSGSAVVVGLARGGVQVAAEVARALEAPLDVVAVRKIRHPYAPEYGLGAVAPGDGVYLRGNDGLTDEEVEWAVTRARDEAVALDGRLHLRRPPVELHGRSAVLVDDGLATGGTMIAAVRWARARGAQRAIAAVPVGAEQTVARIRDEADAVVCPFALIRFGAVGIWYEDFAQVGDEEVLRLLDAAAERQPAPA